MTMMSVGKKISNNGGQTEQILVQYFPQIDHKHGDWKKKLQLTSTLFDQFFSTADGLDLISQVSIALTRFNFTKNR
ncbi:hypothetical protein LXL04_015853 [Taraxacum kok-saghyz]